MPALRPSARRAARAACAARAAAVVALVFAAAPLGAQRALPRAAADPVLDVTPYGGVMRFGNLASGPLGTSLRSQVAPLGGAQLGLRLTRNLALVGNVAYSRSDLEVGLPVIGGVDVGSTSAWLYDAALELRLPNVGTGIAPFVHAGGGAITTRLDSGPARTTNTNPAFVAGGGVDVPLGRTLGLRLYVRDHVARYDAGSVGNIALRGDYAHNVSGGAGLRLSF